MTKTITQNRESGFTLLELLLVIGVAALLLIGGIATYRLVSDGNKTTEATRLLLTLRQELQTMGQQQGGTYNGLGYTSTSNVQTQPLVASGVLRLNQRNPFNGNIIVTPQTSAEGVTDGNVDVEFGNISKPACIKLVQAINTANEVVTISVAGTSVGTLPVTAANATSACTGSVNIITWRFP